MQAWGARHAHLFLEDVAYLRLTYGRIGVSANVHVSWLDPSKVRRVTAVGSRKMAVYNDLSTEERIASSTRASSLPKRAGPRRDPDVLPVRRDPVPVRLVRGAPRGQDRHFLSCVLGESSPMTPGESGLAVVRTLACAERSLLEGRPVDIPQEKEPVTSPVGRAS